MKRIGIVLLLVLFAPPAWAQAFPMKQLFVVNVLNGKNVRDKNLIFNVDTISPQDTEVPTASGFAGCNRWQALFTLKAPDQFELRDIGATKKLCPDDRVMQVESEFLATLAKVSHWRETGRTMTLTGDQVAVQLSRHGPR